MNLKKKLCRFRFNAITLRKARTLYRLPKVDGGGGGGSAAFQLCILDSTGGTIDSAVAARICAFLPKFLMDWHLATPRLITCMVVVGWGGCGVLTRQYLGDLAILKLWHLVLRNNPTLPIPASFFASQGQFALLLNIARLKCWMHADRDGTRGAEV